MRLAGAEYGVYTTLVRHPDLFADFLPFGRRLLRMSSLSARERELLIMRTAYRCRARYEWAHHDVIGRRAGLTDDDIALLGTDVPPVDTDAGTALLLRAADELVADHVLSDATWAQLAATYTVPQMIEICMLVGEYAMLAGTLNSLGVRSNPASRTPAWDET